MTKLKLVSRILALLIFLFGLPFYFGYGNPLPFINPEYSLYENLWLSIFPIIFIGLVLGWKNEMLGGLILVTSIGFGIIVSVAIRMDFGIHMLLPLLAGILFLLVGYKKNKK